MVVDRPIAIRSEPLWLPAGLLAALMLLTMSLSAFGGTAGLEWRPAGVAQRRDSEDGSYKLSGRRARFDRNVRAVDYEEDLYGDSRHRGSVRMRSIVVRDDGDVRVAQNLGDDFGDDFGDVLEQEFAEPMGDATADVPEVEELPAKDDDASDGEDDPLADLFDDDGPEMKLPADEPARTSPKAPIKRPAPAPPADPFDEPRSPATDSLRAPPAAEPPKRLPRERQPDPRLAKELADAEEACDDEREALREKTLARLDLTIGIPGIEGEDYPYVCSLHDGAIFQPRAWSPITYTWKASALCHKPLYFEQHRLERYGHSWGPFVQPLISGAHFFGTLPALPYCMGLTAPNECIYTLGHYRPGNCAPYLVGGVPFTWRAALVGAGAWTAGVFVIP